MPKPRAKHNKGLPKRWRLYHGAYYYSVPSGLEHMWDGKKQFRLGKSLSEAYETWADRLKTLDHGNTIGDMLDRYLREVTPTKAASSQQGDQRNAAKLRPVFGDMPITDIQPSHVYKYYDLRSKKTEDGGGATSARLEVALLKHLYTKIVEWGMMNKHPFKSEVRLKGQAPRTRYVTDEEIVAALSVQPTMEGTAIPMLQAYIRLKLLLGLRRRDMLTLTHDSLQDDGIHVTTSKTGSRMVYEWSDELRAAIDLVRDTSMGRGKVYLFSTRRGECYIDEKTGNAYGWDSLWQRFMAHMIEKKVIGERFTEHDLRAKVASDAESLEHAKALLAHADSRLTQRVYRRKPEKVKPAK